MGRPVRAVAILILGVYVVALCWVLLNPSAEVPIHTVEFLTARAEDLGLPAPVTSRVERLANAAIFLPLPLLGTLLIGQRSWTSWVGLGFVTSLAAEVIQALVLNGRSATTEDVVANTCGVLAGALLVNAAGAARSGVSQATDPARDGRH